MLDLALLTRDPLGVLSMLFLPSLTFDRGSSMLRRKLLPLPGLLISGLSAVSGGLGGGLTGTGGFGGVDFLLFSVCSLMSVAAGVYGFGLRGSSKAPTASLLCALLKVG